VECGQSRTDSAQISGSSPRKKMTFPVRVKHRKQEAVIYGKTAAYPFYRLAYRAAGRRLVKSFSTFSEARMEAEAKVRELDEGNQSSILSAREASEALAIRQAVDAYRRDAGSKVTALEAVTRYLDAARKLAGRSLADAVDAYLKTIVTLKRRDLAQAVAEFIATRAPKTVAKDGKRPAVNPIYHHNVVRILSEFAGSFPAHAVVDLTQDHLNTYIDAHAKLSPKSRNDHRAVVKMFLTWCSRRDYLPSHHRLFEADSMTRELAMSEEIDFFRPAELRALLENSTGPMRAVIALQALAGLRLEEVLRLDWRHVFGIPGYIEVSAAAAKTRQRRLVEMCPSLGAWLQSYRGMTGKIWTQTPSNQGCITAIARLREALDIPARRNGLRHAYVTFHFALHQNENLTAAEAGNSPAMIHAHYKGLATKAEAGKWFAMKPEQPSNVVQLTAHTP
jgi:integrase